MQAGVRPMMQMHTPHLQQHPGQPGIATAQPYDSQHLSQMSLNNRVSFEGMSIEDQTRIMMEQQHRMQAQGMIAGREMKMAPQRQLGIAATPAQPGQHVQQASHVLQPQGVRPMMVNAAQQGQAYMVDAQGRVVPHQWAMQVPRTQQGFPAQGQALSLTQGQHQQMLAYQQQQQQAYQQHHQQQQQQAAAIAAAQQQQQQAQQAAVQAVQQHQMAQQRLSQPPSSRSGNAPTPGQGQSPALLQVPPPPLKRAISRAPSGSASPIPPHMRPPTAQAMQQTQSGTSVGSANGANGQNGPQRASTLPGAPGAPGAPGVSAAPAQAYQAVQTDLFGAGPSRQGQVAQPLDGSEMLGRLSSAVLRRTIKVAVATKARRKEDEETRLRRNIELAQARLDKMKEEAKTTSEQGEAENEDPAVSLRRRFDDHVLEYLHRAGYEAAVQAMTEDLGRLDGTANGPASAVASSTSAGASMDLRTPAERDHLSQSPIKIQSASSPEKAKSESPKKTTSPIRRDFASPVKLTESANAATTAGMDVDGEKDEHNPLFDGEPEKRQAVASGSPSKLTTSPVKANTVEASGGEDVDLGYLYTWFTVFDDTQRAVKQNKLKAFISSAGLSAPNTATPPTSALAARIAVSNPADAVRASSADPGRAQQGDLPDPPPTAITATLRRADELRRAQEIQIQASQQEDARRKSLIMGVNDQMMVGRQPMALANGHQVMTSEHVLAAQQLAQQMSHPAHMMQPHGAQMSHAMQAHAQAQMQAAMMQQNGQFRVETPNGTRVQQLSQGYVQPPQDIAGSPSADSGKRPAASSPVETGGTKRARVGSKRLTPEDHQRQAIEVGSRVASQNMPAPTMPNFAAQPIQRQLSQPSVARPPSEAERQYALAQASYARQQVMASPAAMIGASPSQSSPAHLASPYGGEPNGPHGKTIKRSNTALSVDVESNAGDNVEMTPTTANSSASKKKTSGKKPGKGKKGAQTVKDDFAVPSTPTAAGQGQDQELHYDPSIQHSSADMERSNTSESLGRQHANNDPSGQVPNGQTQSVQAENQQAQTGQQTMSADIQGHDGSDDLMKLWGSGMESGMDMPNAGAGADIFEDFDFGTWNFDMANAGDEGDYLNSM